VSSEMETQTLLGPLILPHRDCAMLHKSVQQSPRPKNYSTKQPIFLKSRQTPCNKPHLEQQVAQPHAPEIANMSRPEDLLPPDLFYNDVESRKYTTNSRIKNIQASMTNRALELLDLRSPSLILDLGCGSGLSGEILSEVEPEEGGPHTWIGMDISASMLGQALDRDVDGDLMLADIGQGVPFRPGSFDAAISISAIQWLCNAESSDVTPEGRLKRFFDGLYASLRRGGRAVCQFYPKNKLQRNMISAAAVKAGFGAGILEDDPGTKSEKLYLVLTVGGGDLGREQEATSRDITGVVNGMTDVDIQDARRKRDQRQRKDMTRVKGSKGWIMRKKDQAEAQGKVVKANSKYTGRKRKIAF
jgi:18S rRNA (guanine1575-N7)-methyltransferase